MSSRPLRLTQGELRERSYNDLNPLRFLVSLEMTVYLGYFCYKTPALFRPQQLSFLIGV